MKPSPLWVTAVQLGALSRPEEMGTGRRREVKDGGHVTISGPHLPLASPTEIVIRGHAVGSGKSITQSRVQTIPASSTPPVLREELRADTDAQAPYDGALWS